MWLYLNMGSLRKLLRWNKVMRWSPDLARLRISVLVRRDTRVGHIPAPIFFPALKHTQRKGHESPKREGGLLWAWNRSLRRIWKLIWKDLHLGLSRLQTVRTETLLCKPPMVCDIWYGSPSRLSQVCMPDCVWRPTQSASGCLFYINSLPRGDRRSVRYGW